MVPETGRKYQILACNHRGILIFSQDLLESLLAYLDRGFVAEQKDLTRIK